MGERGEVGPAPEGRRRAERSKLENASQEGVRAATE